MVKANKGKLTLQGSERIVFAEIACILAGASRFFGKDLVDLATALVTEAKEVEIDARKQ